MAEDAAVVDPANAYPSSASFMTVQASAQQSQSSDPFEQERLYAMACTADAALAQEEIEEYVSEADAASRLYLIV